VLTIQQEGLESQTGGELGGRATAMIQASAALRSSRNDLLRTLISYSKVTKVQTLGSGYKNPGLSDTTLRVHIVKPSGGIIGTCVQERCTMNISIYKHEMR